MLLQGATRPLMLRVHRPGQVQAAHGSCSGWAASLASGVTGGGLRQAQHAVGWVHLARC